MSRYNNISLKFKSQYFGYDYSQKISCLSPKETTFYVSTQRDIVTAKECNSSTITYQFICWLLLAIIMLNNLANATLSATSAQSIQGSAPYLTFDKGKHKITNTDDLLWMSFNHDEKTIIYTKANNRSSASNPIEVPTAINSFKDIYLPIPADTPLDYDDSQTITLDELVKPPYSFWEDADQDGKGENGISGQGSLTLEIRDANGWSVKRSDPFVPCNSEYYQIKLNNTDSQINTQYGNPSSTNYDVGSIIFFIRHKPKPYACWVTPNLSANGGYQNKSGYNGPNSQWDFNKGFFTQDLDHPEKNFPTTGSKGMFFNLTMAVSLANNISYSKQPSDSIISLNISQVSDNKNIAKIELIGPSDGSSAQMSKLIPTTFTIYSDNTKTTPIYTFKINRWFIVRPNSDNTKGTTYAEAEQYCKDLGYRVPNVLELTNANNKNSPVEWNIGLQNQPNNYQRIIGGGLLAEWGMMLRGSYHNDVSSMNFWTTNAKKFNNKNLHYVVGTNIGDINLTEDSEKAQGICVSP